MFYDDFRPVMITYPEEAAGWKEGVYHSRKKFAKATDWAEAFRLGQADAVENSLAIKNKMWTETEVTGFGIFPYVEGIALSHETHQADGRYTCIFLNPTDEEISVSCYANGILKIDGASVSPKEEIKVRFNLCSIEEESILQFFIKQDAKAAEDSNEMILYLKSLAYEMLPQKEEQPKKTVFIASDSTAQTYEEFYYPQTGWGQKLAVYFNGDASDEGIYPEDMKYPQCHIYETKNIKIENRSIGARSSRSFIDEGKWDALLMRAHPGDWCLIQWGHNDATAVRPNRYVPAEEFGDYLIKYINSCRARQIFPIIVTPVSRRNCDENAGAFPLSFAAYRDAALKTGKNLGVPVVDLCKRSNELLKKYGPEESKRLHLWCKPGEYPDGAYADGVSDNTHLQEYGALAYAKIVAEELCALDYPEINSIKQYISVNIDINQLVDIKGRRHEAGGVTCDDTVRPTGFALQEIMIENNTANFLLIWDDVKNATGYTVYRKGSVDFQFFPLRTVTADEKKKSALMPFTLPAADVYQVYVTARLADGTETGPSRKIEFRA